MLYRVVLVGNGVYKKTLSRSTVLKTIYSKYHQMIDENTSVKFPKKFINTNKIIPITYSICVTKQTEETDVFRNIRDDYGRVISEKPLGDWTILASSSYNIEEKFWIWGNDSKKNRPTIDLIIKKVTENCYKKNMYKQVIVVNNKLLIHNEVQFDMIICKCLLDAQRLHHTLNKITKKLKCTNAIFVGTATKSNIGKFYNLIHDRTNWPLEKIRRLNTRP